MKILLCNDTQGYYHFGCSATSMALKNILGRFGTLLPSCTCAELWAATEVPASLVDIEDDAFFNRWVVVNKALADKIRCADVCVITGEGTLTGWEGRNGTRALLYLAYVAKVRFNRTVYIVNQSAFPVLSPYDVDEGNEACRIYEKVFKAADFVACRDVYSLAILNRLGVTAELAFDCLPFYVDRLYRPVARPIVGDYVCISGGILFAQDFERFLYHDLAKYSEGFSKRFVFLMADTGSYISTQDAACISIIEKWNKENSASAFSVDVFVARDVDEWLTVIRDAKLLISGRFHHSLAAWSLGTDYICFDSSTPKIMAVKAISGHSHIFNLVRRNFLPFEKMNAVEFSVFDEEEKKIRGRCLNALQTDGCLCEMMGSEIETLKRKLVIARQGRDEARRKAAEMRAQRDLERERAVEKLSAVRQGRDEARRKVVQLQKEKEVFRRQLRLTCEQRDEIGNKIKEQQAVIDLLKKIID